MLSNQCSETPFQADVARIGTGVVVAFSGELDVANAPAMRECLGDVILQNRLGFNLEVNLSEVQFIDSVCIGLLVSSGNRLKESGGSMAILNPSPQVRRLMEITGLVQLFLAEEADSRSVQL
jgi:anti-anti-sigma factor